MRTATEPSPLPTPAAIDLAGLTFGYAAERVVRDLQSGYADAFKEHGSTHVLDIGCGRGIFLDLLRQRGIEAVGLDSHSPSISGCRKEGFEVIQADALEGLEDLATQGQQYDGLFCSHVIEHFAPAMAARLFQLCSAVLSPGGLAMFVTPNAANPHVLGEICWLDPTHVRPYPRALLERLGDATGMRTSASYDDPKTAPSSLWKRVQALLSRGLLGMAATGPMDSVVAFIKE